MEKIDVVVTWVDGQDPKWLEEKSKYTPETKFDGANTNNRYEQSQLFKYWFRGIEKNAPWVNKIFFITYGHLPDWLDTSNPKLKIVKHTDYIPSEYLPTYNSNVIELNIHRIEELSEKFILFNDDFFVIDNLEKSDFFLGDKVKDLAVYKPIIPAESFNHVELSNAIIINKYFKGRAAIRKNPFKFFRIQNGSFNLYNLFALFSSKVIGYKTGHVAQPHLKSTFKLLWEKEGTLLDSLGYNKFRKENDVSHYLMAHWNIESDKFVPRNKNFGNYFLNDQIAEISDAINSSKYKVICINDNSEMSVKEMDDKLEEVFQRKFPEKSSFEL